MSFGGNGGGSGSIHTSSDVALSNAADGQVLTYNTSLQKWQNQTPVTGAGIDTASTSIQPLGTRAAGSVGKAADAGHVHAMPTLNQISAPTAAVAMNSQKLTGLANGTVAGDAVTIGQIPTSGTTASSYAAGNDSRITGALQASNNLSDLANAATARSSLGLGTAATQATSAFDVAGAAAAVTTTSIGALPTGQKAVASGLASLDSSTLVPRAQLGSGTANSTTLLYGDGTWKTAPAATSYAWTATKTAAYTAAAGDAVPVDATSASITITLPTSPAANTNVRVKKLDSSVNSVIVASAAKIDTANSYSIGSQFASQDFSYNGSTWYLV